MSNRPDKKNATADQLVEMLDDNVKKAIRDLARLDVSTIDVALFIHVAVRDHAAWQSLNGRQDHLYGGAFTFYQQSFQKEMAKLVEEFVVGKAAKNV